MVKKLPKYVEGVTVSNDKPAIEPAKTQHQIPIISNDPKKQKAFEEIIEKYDELFRKLAEH